MTVNRTLTLLVFSFLDLRSNILRLFPSNVYPYPTTGVLRLPNISWLLLMEDGEFWTRVEDVYSCRTEKSGRILGKSVFVKFTLMFSERLWFAVVQEQYMS